MKKFYITLLEILFCVGFAFAQTPGDRPETATQITQCGITYTGNNASFTDNCGGDNVGVLVVILIHQILIMIVTPYIQVVTVVLISQVVLKIQCGGDLHLLKIVIMKSA